MGPAQTSGSKIIGIEVPGGSLAVEMVSSGTEPVLAIHGISSQRKLWNWLRATAPDLSLIAPDTPPRPSGSSAKNSTRWSRCVRCPASITPLPS